MHSSRASLWLLILLSTTICGQEVEKPTRKNPFAGQPEAIAAGRKLYVESCSGCHGPTGEGGRGPNLSRSDEVRHMQAGRLFDMIRNGVPGSDMPPSRQPDDKIWQIAAFVRSLSAPAFDSPVAGNPEAGGTVFFGKGDCVKCHAIEGRGGALGPDLTDSGRRYSMTQLREAVLAPDARIADGYRGVTVITRAGQTISGVARDNTNYSIAVQDAGGTLHLLLKQDLREVVFRKKSLMPADYKQRLSSGEIEDVLAFLARQSLRPKSAEQNESASPVQED